MGSGSLMTRAGRLAVWLEGEADEPGRAKVG